MRKIFKKLFENRLALLLACMFAIVVMITAAWVQAYIRMATTIWVKDTSSETELVERSLDYFLVSVKNTRVSTLVELGNRSKCELSTVTDRMKQTFGYYLNEMPQRVLDCEIPTHCEESVQMQVYVMKNGKVWNPFDSISIILQNICESMYYVARK